MSERSFYYDGPGEFPYADMLARVLDRAGVATSDVAVNYDLAYQGYVFSYKRGGKMYRFVMPEGMIEDAVPAFLEQALFHWFLGDD